MKARDYLVTVCAECSRASCWHGEFYCEHYKGAGTKRILASTLRRMKLENQSHYSKANLMRVISDVVKKGVAT